MKLNALFIYNVPENNMKKILLTGGAGLLGLALLKQVPKGYQVIAGFHKNTIGYPKNKNIKIVPLDILNQKQIKSVFEKIRPDILIHAASEGNVDYCEKNQKQASRINVKATQDLVEAAQRFNTKIIYPSTNAVFDGKRPPYSEKDKPHPINFYGKTKLEGEKIVQKASPKNVVVRLMTMYGWSNPEQRDNPVTWILSKLKNKEKIKMVDDVYCNPLYNLDAARALWKIIKLDKRGIYHIAGKDRVDRFNWALMIAEVFDLDKNLISPIKSSFFKDIVKRPKDTTYSTLKMEKELGIIPRGLKEGLIHMKNNPLLYRSFDEIVLDKLEQ